MTSTHTAQPGRSVRSISMALSMAAIVTLAAPAIASAFPSPGTIRVCYGQDNCTSSQNGLVHQTTSLQSALSYLHTHPRSAGQRAYVLLSPGFYYNLDFSTNESNLQTIRQKDWRTDNGQGSCSLDNAYVGFVMRNQSNVTIRGTGGNPTAVKIWGKVPNYVVAFPGAEPIFHAFAIEGGSSIEIDNVSVVGDGGYIGNGAGDASLYVKSATVDIYNTVILGNKQSSNCLQGHVAHDQEGLLVDGGIVQVFNSAIGGNIHTGAMVLDGGMLHVEDTLVRGNGWDGGEFQNNGNGHGITSFYHSTETTCYDGNTHIEVEDSDIRNNTGHGVYYRGAFLWSYQDVVGSNLRYNRGYGVRIDGGWDPGLTTLVSAVISITQNLITGNTLGTISYDDVDLQGSAAIITSPNSGTSLDFTTRWNQLLAVSSYMDTQVARICP